MTCHLLGVFVQPISLNLAKLPHINDEVVQEREEIAHIQLFHCNGHYDAIVAIESGKCVLKHQDSQEKMTQRGGSLYCL